MHRSGTVLAGRYRIIRHVGSGGMASVHLARDEVLDREVAVKSVHAEPDSDVGRRIMREARLGASLRHPHLVTVYDVVPEGGALLLVTEFVEGGTLADELRRGPVEVPRALAILSAVADALDHAHEQGIVHRDVKPANVLLGTGGAVKLADLGIATAADSTRITRTGGALGTVAYMAPEQFEPGPATPAVDIYALASVAFEALAGERAYPGATAFQVFERLRDGAPPPDVREHRPDLPEAVTAAVRHGMATDPADRPASAGALVAGLREALAVGGVEELAADEPPPAADATRPMPAVERHPARPRRPTDAPPPAAPRRRRSAVVPLALLGTLALAGTIVAISVGGGDEDEPSRSERRSTAPAKTTTAPAQAAPARGVPTPAEAVRRFYSRAAEGDFRGSWQLAGPRFRAEYGNSRQAFADDFSSLRGIRFDKLDEVRASETTATVALQTVAEHTDRTDRCSGTVETVMRGGRWRVEPFGVSCDPG